MEDHSGRFWSRIGGGLAVKRRYAEADDKNRQNRADYRGTGKHGPIVNYPEQICRKEKSKSAEEMIRLKRNSAMPGGIPTKQMGRPKPWFVWE